MREIADGVYFENDYISGNVGCVLTEEGAVLIDSPMLPKDAWHWLKQIASKTKLGVACLVSTDYRVDRVLGNCFFPPTVTIAHQAAWIEMQRYDEAFLQRYMNHNKHYQEAFQSDLARTRVVFPELTLTKDMTVYKGDRIMHLIFAGGHTPASIMLHLPAERLLFAGNVVVTAEHPDLSHAITMNWLHALEKIRGMDDVDLIVPGRGEPCDLSATEILTDYIIKIRERVYEYYSSGYTRRETVDKVKMEDFYSIPAARRGEIERRIRGSVERVYDEYKKGTSRRRR
jgi:cyclase